LVWCRVSELLRLFNVEYKILKSFDVSLCWFLKNLFVVNIVVVAAGFLGFQKRKKLSSIYFLWKKNSIREKKKKVEKNQIENILKGKKLKGKKLVVGVLSAALLCIIHGATVENILFEDSDDVNTFHTFNPTQVFLHLKKKILLTRCGVRTNMVVIILLRNYYFLKYFFKKIY